jgi:hypothetical protein
VSGDPDPHVLEAGHHPTPFTAAEIRDGSAVGLTLRLRVEEAGTPAWTQVTRFVAVDAEGADRLSHRVAADGSTSEPGHDRSRWLDLQRHASFPATATTIEKVVADTPMGPLACLRYTVIDGDAIATFWFARSMPGMPIRTERTEGGRVVESVEMLSRAVEPHPGAT